MTIKRDPYYSPPTMQPGDMVRLRAAATTGTMAAHFGVGRTQLAPHVKSSPCGPGQTILPGGKCGNQAPPPPTKQCPSGTVQYGTTCFPIPPQGTSVHVVLALKAIDASGQPALRFYGYVPGGPNSSAATTNAYVFVPCVPTPGVACTDQWLPTKLDAQMLTTMSIVAGKVPPGMMLAIKASVVPGVLNVLEMVPAVNVAKRAVVNSSTAGSSLGAPGTRKPILNTGPKMGRAILPLGAGMAEFYGAKKRRPIVRTGTVAAPRPNAYYITVRGDTMRSIAAMHGISATVLARMNPSVVMDFGRPMSGGFRLVVPSRG